MKRTIKIFTLRSSKNPGEPPQPAGELLVEAPSFDALRNAARHALSSEGYRIRSLSFGPTGLVAYVEVPEVSR
jgi:hypothetical protein